MTVAYQPEASRQFDLDNLVEREREENSRSALVPVVAGTVIGFLLVGVGTYVAIRHESGSSAADYAEGLVLAALGAAIAAGSWIYVRALRRKPNLLIITNDFVSYGRKGEPQMTERRWDDPGLKLVLHDRTNLRAKLQERDRFAVFSLVPEGSTRIPLPQDAFDTIISEAQRHGLSVKRQELYGVAILTIVPLRSST